MIKAYASRALRLKVWIVGIVGLLIHFCFLLGGSYQKSYDAYTHIFFASHWLRSWWSAFEPGWYAGFSVFTYPPFSHQLIALPAFLIGLEPAFVVMQMLALLAMLVGMYRYTRIWYPVAVAMLAALLLLFLPALAMTLHLFGQYPNTISLALVLNLLVFVDDFLTTGNRKSLLKGELLLIPAAFTSLFGNFLGVFFFALPLLVKHFKKERALRLFALVTLGIGTLFACLAPFFYYMRQNPFVQMSIPHGSRDNVLLPSMLNYFTFYGLYGPLLPLIVVWLGVALWKRRGLSFVFPVAFLLLLSTGGATSLNRALLGPLFDVLTFDRFAFWNSILVLPVLADELTRFFAWLRYKIRGNLVFYGVVGFSCFLYLASFALNAGAYLWRPLPPVLELQEMQRVLDRPEYRGTRYLTLGLGGNNVSALSTYHSAASLDGNYNFARRVPELNQSPIALLDEAKYYGEQSIDALAKLLLNPRKYNLKLLFLRDQYYTPLLEASGWQRVERLSQGVDVWAVSLDIAPVSPREPEPISPSQLIWSLMPLGTFGFWLVLMFREHRHEV